jgi:hypothetical protein
MSPLVPRAYWTLLTLFLVFTLQIIGFWFTVSESMSEIEGVLKEVAARYKLHGFEGPCLFYTDSCCKERNTLKQVINFLDSFLMCMS